MYHIISCILNSTIHLLKRYPHKINVITLMNNDRAIEIIVKNGRLQNQFIDWYNLIESKHIKYIWDNFREEVINMLITHLPQDEDDDEDDIIYTLACNTYAIDVFNYCYENNMIPEEYLNDPDFWKILSMNHNALHILEKIRK